MPATPIETLDIRTRREWRRWLEKHHDNKSVIWLVFHKVHTGVECLGYDDAVEEALCCGWIDSIVRRLDEDRFVRKFTPRKVDSVWSPSNRRRYADLKKRGLLAEPGLRRPPTDKTDNRPRPDVSVIPSYVENEFKKNRRAWEHFQALAHSHRRMYIGWIDSAKREETKLRRLREAMRLLAEGKKLGLK